MTAMANRVAEVLRSLERRGTRRIREEMRTRYGIIAPKAFGVRVGEIQQVAKKVGRDHELALALWETGWYEARMLCAYVDDPARVTAAQMDRWARDFDNWGITDTLCFALFDRTPHAWKKVGPWSRRQDEFVKRAAFALLASLGVHDKQSGDEPFHRSLKLIERGAFDERNFVKKGVSWALRVVGRRSRALHPAAVELARRLAESSNAGARWVGKDALRELTSAKLRTLMARRANRVPAKSKSPASKTR
jgi:3-methyladenine DNA glycosylase AlkD